MKGNGHDAEALRVRMYRVGFGDCFLLSVPAPGRTRHLLIDCGVHARGNVGTLPQVVANIRKETQDQIDVVVVTHAHQDHISGFGSQAEDFRKVRVGEVWLPWTEDPRDPNARELRAKQLQLALQLRAHLAATRKMTRAFEDILENFVGFNLASNADSLRVIRSGFKGSPRIRYLEAGDALSQVADLSGLDVEVLGPPRDHDFLRKMNPPSGQRWLGANGAGQPFERPVTPFATHQRTRSAMKRVEGACVLDRHEERALTKATEADGTLALTLDSIMNNTSLVLLFKAFGATLLFPGDAQWGNWAAWLAKQGSDSILGDICFYKVGHHGSHNATPKTTVAKMAHPELAAMISTQSHPFPTIPEPKLVRALGQQSSKRIARSDWITVKGATGAKAPKSLGKPFKRGELWIDYLRPV